METTDQPGRERTRSNTLWTLGGCAVAIEGDRLHLSTIVGGMAIMLLVLEMGLGMPILAAVNLPLCSECIHLDEPPWYPNGRKRCQIRVETVFRSKELGEGASKTIAAFLTSHVVP